MALSEDKDQNNTKFQDVATISWLQRYSIRKYTGHKTGNIANGALDHTPVHCSGWSATDACDPTLLHSHGGNARDL